ncbi:unnamed protein product, partial [Discosporangium mesarthrocarpum]
SLSLDARFGSLEALALGGAATRWLLCLGPKPGVLPIPSQRRHSSGGMQQLPPYTPRTATLTKEYPVIWPLQQGMSLHFRLEVSSLALALPVNASRPHGRALRLSLGRVSAKDSSPAIRSRDGD